MKKQPILLAAIIAVSIFLMPGCASLTGFEEGRTVGEKNMELVVSGNFTRVPDLFDDEDSGILDSINTTISFPNIEASFKYGVIEKLDVGIRASSNINLSIFAKYQLIGNQSSTFALSPGLELGTVLGAAFNVGIPIYATYYPTEKIAINLAPRFVYQFISGGESNGASYVGGNFGLLFGKRNKFGLDIGYYNVNNSFIGDSGIRPSLFTFGVGGKFKFGKK